MHVYSPALPGHNKKCYLHLHKKKARLTTFHAVLGFQGVQFLHLISPHTQPSGILCTTFLSIRGAELVVAFSPPADDLASADFSSVMAMNLGSFNMYSINHSMKYETIRMWIRDNNMFRVRYSEKKSVFKHHLTVSTMNPSTYLRPGCLA